LSPAIACASRLSAGLSSASAILQSNRSMFLNRQAKTDFLRFLPISPMESYDSESSNKAIKLSVNCNPVWCVMQKRCIFKVKKLLMLSKRIRFKNM
jgi:hypothetical protein